MSEDAKINAAVMQAALKAAESISNGNKPTVEMQKALSAAAKIIGDDLSDLAKEGGNVFGPELRPVKQAMRAMQGVEGASLKDSVDTIRKLGLAYQHVTETPASTDVHSAKPAGSRAK
jgi:hypothetical protein